MFLRILLLLIAIAALPVGGARARDLTTVAGQITFVIGEVSVERQTDGAIPVRRGDSVHSGDVIRTTANGHIHIRFADDSRVSVRPGSVFRVVEFRYNPEAPKDSLIRFQLDAGDLRAISGSGAKAAPERFRLNTPLVAIGVKGTDFITQVRAGLTQVFVNEGGIVMSPFGLGCSAETLGACQSEMARALGAGSGQMLVYHAQTAAPVYQQRLEQDDSSKLHHLIQQMHQNGKDADKVLAEARDPGDALPERRMTWGRWASVSVPGDELTQPFLEAMRGNEVTVGDGYYFLFREPNVPNILPGLNSAVDFRLTGASAYYRTSANEIAPATVQSGTLGVNFAQRSYDTQLSLMAEGVAPQAFTMSGQIDAQTGIFLGNNGAGSLAGALGLDGQKAGYLFRHPAAGGSLIGATQWGAGK